jgi:hypothetical protein
MPKTAAMPRGFPYYPYEGVGPIFGDLDKIVTESRLWLCVSTFLLSRDRDRRFPISVSVWVLGRAKASRHSLHASAEKGWAGVQRINFLAQKALRVIWPIRCKVVHSLHRGLCVKTSRLRQNPVSLQILQRNLPSPPFFREGEGLCPRTVACPKTRFLGKPGCFWAESFRRFRPSSLRARLQRQYSSQQAIRYARPLNGPQNREVLSHE